MLKSFLAGALVASALIGAAATDVSAASGPIRIAAGGRTVISPTCTLDPFSGIRDCRNAPACFYDPLTGKHFCPEGRGAGRART